VSPLPPLILVNGYAATVADWDPAFLDQLSRDHDVICPENRGMGTRELGEGELTIASMAADVVALLDERGIASAPVAGWSMGGFIAQEVARMAPERVEALVLMSTDPGGPAAVRTAPEAWARLTDHGGTPREQATRLIGLLFPPPVAARIDRDFGEAVARARAELSPGALEAQEAAMENWYAAERPPVPAAIPVLAAAGDLDEVVPAINARALAGGTGWLAPFAGGGHAFMAQEPERLAALIAAFLRSG
jgi:pimeloyl-ACP methyl ester carboxylesterase